MESLGMQSARHRCLAVSWWDVDKHVGNCISWAALTQEKL